MPMPVNIDLGELPDEPDELYALASIANLACGGHAGADPEHVRRAIERARRAGARISAHPSYPDRQRFGRVSLVMNSAELHDTVQAQCLHLRALAERAGDRVVAVKPHGALYHDAGREPAIASCVVDGAVDALGSDVLFIGPPEGAFAETAHARGLAYAREGFADRGYVRRAAESELDAFRAGRLVPRTEPGAVLDSATACADQALRLEASGAVDTICVHGDNPRAVEIARAVRAALDHA